MGPLNIRWQFISQMLYKRHESTRQSWADIEDDEDTDVYEIWSLEVDNAQIMYIMNNWMIAYKTGT